MRPALLPAPQAFERWLVVAAIAVALVSAAARFVALGSDFPIELTWSEAPYTDEGWYSNSAVRHAQRGLWFLEADVNEAAIMPIFHLVQRVGFAVLGMSLDSLRLVSLLFFLALTFALCAVARDDGGPAAGALMALLLLSNFHLFAYSRVALVELPMLAPAALGLWIMRRLPTGSAWQRGLVGGLAATGSGLLKFSGLFVGPALLVCALALGETRKQRLWALCGYGAGAAVAGVYWACQLRWRRADVLHFLESLVAGEQHNLDVDLTNSAYHALLSLAWIDPALAVAMALAGWLALANLFQARASWRKWPARLDVQLLLLAAFGYAVPALTSYQPTRYFLPPLLFGSALVAVVAARALRARSWVAPALLALMAWSAADGAVKIGRHLASLETSYAQAFSAIGEHLSEGDVLMGNPAPLIALETNVWAISGGFGTGTFEERALLHRPSHYVSKGPIPSEDRAVFEQACTLRLIGAYEVFGIPANSLHLYLLEGCRWGPSP